MVNKIFKELVNNRLVSHPKTHDFFSDFLYAFRSSQSTVGLIAVLSDRIGRSFNMSRATQAVAFHLMEFQVMYFALLCLFSLRDH